MLREIVNRVLNPDGSISIDDPEIIKAFTDEPDFPFLVSFPRTGSHWLRMLMELYFEKPALVRVFYYNHAKDYTCYHTRDLDLSIARKNVIYLYRDPAETVYSQLSYHRRARMFLSDLQSAAAAREALAKLRAHYATRGEIGGDSPSIGAGSFRFSEPGRGPGLAVAAGRHVAGIQGELTPEGQDRLLRRLVDRLGR